MKCKQCGEEFTLTQSEIKFYKSRNLELPKRCAKCRQMNKQQKRKDENIPAEKSTGNPPAKSKVQMIATIIIVVILVVFGVKGLFTPDSPNSSKTAQPTANTTQSSLSGTVSDYKFQTAELRREHYQKHGIDMGFDSAETYETAAGQVVGNPDVLHKTEAEDGDDVYYLEATNEFVIISAAGYLRTYFNPEDGMDYYERQ
ncbi:MAG: zinc-ribbon domain containing protein [Lachnospiraceae bacterium]|nr:zinc-ribbon domain containing protein [Lachnospiraceae bacterium]